MFLRCLPAVAGLCLAIPAGALNLTYGQAFTVEKITRQNAAVQLPLSRGKYANVKLLTRSVYEFLTTCKTPCRLERDTVTFTVQDFRAAKTHSGMWIAEVEINGEIALTFLVFKQGGQFSIKPPEPVKFLDETLLEAIKTRLKALAQQDEMQTHK